MIKCTHTMQKTQNKTPRYSSAYKRNIHLHHIGPLLDGPKKTYKRRYKHIHKQLNTNINYILEYIILIQPFTRCPSYTFFKW